MIACDIFSNLSEIDSDTLEQAIDDQYKKMSLPRFSDMATQIKQLTTYMRETDATYTDDDMVKAIALNDVIAEFVSAVLVECAASAVRSPAMKDVIQPIKDQFAFRVLMLASIRAFVRFYKDLPGDDDAPTRMQGVSFILGECKDCMNERLGVSLINQIYITGMNKFYPLKP